MNIKLKNILFGYCTSSLGSWIDFITILTLSAYQFNASPYEMAVISALSLLPGIILTKNLGQLLESGSVILILILSLLLRIGATVGIILSQSIEIFIIFVALRSVFNSVMQPAINVLSIQMLKGENSTKFYSLMNMINNISKLIVPILGAVSSSVIGERAILLVSIGFTSISLLSFLLHHKNSEISIDKENLEKILPEGNLSKKKPNTMLPLLWCVATYFFFVFMLNNQMAIILMYLQFDKAALGMLMSCSAAGNILSGIMTAKFSIKYPITGKLSELMIPGASTAVGFGLIGITLNLPQSFSLYILLLVFFSVGIFSARFAIASNVFVSLNYSQFSGIASVRLQSIQNISILIAPLAGEYILSIAGAKTLFFISSILGLVSFLFLYLYCHWIKIVSFFKKIVGNIFR
ncbi:MFS transporter [Photorhabdus africana]|uniref:MFS transporter n=1 Tax=Photorhabdus africana TaxID=3097554 RepID=UPI002B4095D8|nr:MFS transporter [Photorhabdus sp. CRI-LC]